MANNLFTNVVPQIFAKAVKDVARKNSVMPRLVDRDLESDARSKGDTIDIALMDDATIITVAPAVYAATAVTVQPTKVQLPLDWWKEVPFTMEDKEMQEVVNGVLPGRATAAMEALVRAVDAKICTHYRDIADSGGVAGTTPFASTVTALIDARTALNKELCPVDGRNVVLNADAEGLAVGLPQFYQANTRGDQEGILKGRIGEKFGAQWYLNQNIQDHVTGILIEATILVETAVAVGASEIMLRGTAGGNWASGTLAAGDIFHLDGDDAGLNYAVVTAATVTGTLCTIPILPHARKTYATTIAATGIASHAANLYFHPSAFVWASRPLQMASALDSLGSIFSSTVDPISGLALRLEVRREHRQVRWAFDILGGSIAPFRERSDQRAARILG